MEWVFKNNGKEYRFRDDTCGGGQFLSINYGWLPGFQLRSIKLIEKNRTIKKMIVKPIKVKKLFGYREILQKEEVEENIKENFLKIGYQIFSSSNDVSYTEISILPEENEMAKEVIAYLQPKIEEYKAYKKKTDEDNAIYNMKTVSVEDEDGNIHQLATNLCLKDDSICLVCGGNTYHTHLNCFKNWTVDMRKNFKGWKIISIKEAKKQGLKKCSFCEENDHATLEDVLNEVDNIEDNEEYI